MSQTADLFDGLFHRSRVTDNATEFLVALKEIDDARDAIRRVSQHCDRTDGSTTCPRPPDQGRTAPRQNCCRYRAPGART